MLTLFPGSLTSQDAPTQGKFALRRLFLFYERQSILVRRDIEIRSSDKRNLIAVVVGVVLVSLGAFSMLQGGESEIDVEHNISVGGSLNPYSTEVSENGAVRFVNSRNDNISVKFETGIEDFLLPSKGSKVIDLSMYDNLPKKNYFSAAGEGGRLVLE